MMPLFDVLQSLTRGVSIATLGFRMTEINTVRSEKSPHTFLYQTMLLRYDGDPPRAVLSLITKRTME